MKKYLILFVSIVLVSCETKTLEVPVVAGEQFWGDNQGEGFVPGPKEDLQTALDILYGYADAEFDMISEKSLDTVYFRPEKGGEVITMAKPFTDFLKGLHEPYDSIKRQAWNAYPISPVGAENYTIVSIPFSETRYKKDGTVENESIFERFILKDGKLLRVNKWVAESN